MRIRESSSSLVIREMHLKTAMVVHLSEARMPIKSIKTLKVHEDAGNKKVHVLLIPGDRISREMKTHDIRSTHNE